MTEIRAFWKTLRNEYRHDGSRVPATPRIVESIFVAARANRCRFVSLERPALQFAARRDFLIACCPGLLLRIPGRRLAFHPGDLGSIVEAIKPVRRFGGKRNGFSLWGFRKTRFGKSLQHCRTLSRQKASLGCDNRGKPTLARGLRTRRPLAIMSSASSSEILDFTHRFFFLGNDGFLMHLKVDKGLELH